MNTHINLFTNSQEEDDSDQHPHTRPIDFPDNQSDDNGNIPFNSVRNNNESGNNYRHMRLEEPS
jgi:hypothetical protein